MVLEMMKRVEVYQAMGNTVADPGRTLQVGNKMSCLLAFIYNFWNDCLYNS